MSSSLDHIPLLSIFWHLFRLSVIMLIYHSLRIGFDSTSSLVLKVESIFKRMITFRPCPIAHEKF
ncbi:hypothetical protein BDV35DRAFT_344767 [Aspergillus flavus]|uniref:Uncharacterized protein n=1 Tax=Aspergillus flavus TaxID=5059 RepID=A0A5N6H788_ASPFL|nr:hypothetical protein BDV35DRAFT_344767 [Aspergillus flavus]